MKKWLWILLILFLLGLISAFCVWKFYINKPHTDIENTQPAYTMTAQELWKLYNADLKLSDSLYTGKIIEVTGNLSRIDKSDTVVYAIFVMEIDSMFGDKSVRCEMLPKYQNETSTITKNAPIKVKGYCNGFDQTDIKFSKCSIIK
jgi:hypothetical protein